MPCTLFFHAAPNPLPPPPLQKEVPKLKLSDGVKFIRQASLLLNSSGHAIAMERLETLMRFLLGKTPEETELTELDGNVNSNGSINVDVLFGLKSKEIPEEVCT